MIIPTLAAIEDPNPDLYVRIDLDQNNSKGAADEAGMPLTPPKPITSKLRTTIRHLTARAGRWARFRGLKMYIAWAVASTVVVGLLEIPLVHARFFGRSAARVLAEILLANLEMAWIHIVISEPSTKPFYKRIPGRKSWAKIAPAVALRVAASQIALYLPLAIMTAVSNSFTPDVSVGKMVGASIGVLVAFLALAVLVEVPANVTFIRVAASMLPEEDEAIVPFDRTFGGKVIPTILGGSGKIGLLEAWKSFDWASRARFMKVLVKVFMIELALGVSFALILVGEISLFATEPVGKSIPLF